LFKIFGKSIFDFSSLCEKQSIALKISSIEEVLSLYDYTPIILLAFSVYFYFRDSAITGFFLFKIFLLFFSIFKFTDEDCISIKELFLF
jgi:hypothetical protein